MEQIEQTNRPWQFIKSRLWEYALLTRINKPIGTLLLLWPLLWALWIASNGQPHPWVLIVFLLGTWFMRSAGCAINDFADRNIDLHVKRTKNRPLAKKSIYPKEAIAVFLVLSLASFALVLTQNRLTILLSIIGIILAASYPFMKRYHHLPQVHLGMAFGWAIPMVWAAQTNQFPSSIAWLIFVSAIIWATIYDTEYAIVDREYDLKIGVKSTAILFGDADKLIIGILQILMILSLWLIGQQANLGWPYTLALFIAASMFIYQQVLIKDRLPDPCFKAFMNNNWLGAILFTGILISYLIKGH